MRSGFTLRIRKDDEDISAFLKIQNSPSESLRFLVEKAIRDYGMTDLSSIFPSNRTEEFWKSFSSSNNQENEIRTVSKLLINNYEIDEPSVVEKIKGNIDIIDSSEDIQVIDDSDDSDDDDDIPEGY